MFWSNNIETKKRIDKYQEVYERAKVISDTKPQILVQRDVYFNVSAGRLKLRTINNKTSELIYYFRPDNQGPKPSSYKRVRVILPTLVEYVFKSLLGLKGLVEKQRTLFLYKGNRIHLDQVNSLGEFAEIEVILRGSKSRNEGEKELSQMLEMLGIEVAGEVKGSYIDLVSKNRSQSSGKTTRAFQFESK